MEVSKPKSKFILVFRSIHDVIKSERIIKDMSILYQIIPLPSNLSSDCGMCIELEEMNLVQTTQELTQKSVNFKVYPK